MTPRARAILLVVAIVAAIAAAAVVRSRTARPAEDKPALLLPAAREQLGKIARVHIKRGPTETLLEQREQEGRPAWVVASKHGYPADSERVRKMIAELLDSKVVEAKTSKPENYERIGVVEPDKPGAAGVLVDVQDPAGASLGAVIIGNASSAPTGEDSTLAGPRYFVRRKGEAQSWLAQGNLSVAAEPMSWVNRSPLEVDIAKVRTATITHLAEPREAVAVSKQLAADGTFKFDALPEGRQPKDEFAATRVAQAISGVVIDDVAPASSVDMSQPELTAVFTTFEGQTITVACASKDGARWWSFGASFEPTPAPPHPAVPENADEAAKAAAEKSRADAEKLHQESMAAIQKKTEELSRRLAGWVFVLPEYKVKALMVRQEELLAPPPVPTEPAPQAPAAPEETPQG
jgi:hypothetical protein